jgi:hypothetical protein
MVSAEGLMAPQRSNAVIASATQPAVKPTGTTALIVR